jgi:hypothetical protein
MDEVELPGPDVGAQVGHPPERGATLDPDPFDSEAIK